jgi:hypothetical protein
MSSFDEELHIRRYWRRINPIRRNAITWLTAGELLSDQDRGQDGDGKYRIPVATLGEKAGKF